MPIRDKFGRFIKGSNGRLGSKTTKKTKLKQRLAKLINPTKYWTGKSRHIATEPKQRKNGYRYIAISLVEPEVKKLFKRTTRPIAEHQYVWCKYNKLCIPKGYIIHHKNHIRNDNSIENLMLMKSGDHARLHLKGVKKQSWYKNR